MKKEKELFELLKSILGDDRDHFNSKFSLHYDNSYDVEEIKCYHSNKHLFKLTLQLEETESAPQGEDVYYFDSDFDGFDELALTDALAKIKDYADNGSTKLKLKRISHSIAWLSVRCDKIKNSEIIASSGAILAQLNLLIAKLEGNEEK